jgi:hypothetical protein
MEHPPVATRVVSSDFSSTIVEIELGLVYQNILEPVGAGLVAVPPTAGVTVSTRSLSVRHQDAEGAWGEPVQTPPAEWPGLVAVGEPGIWRDLRVVSVMVTPRPAVDVLVDRLTVELVYEGAGANQLTHWGRPISPEFERLYRGAVLNYDWLDVEPWSRSDAVRYVIVYADQLGLGAASLAWWRNLTGMKAITVSRSEIGGGTPADKNQIRAYLQDAYDNWPQPPEFVVLLGDLGPPSSSSEEMPSHWRGSFASDHWYSLLDGGDYYADVLVGRLPARTITECLYVVNKVIQYERDPVVDLGVTWQDKALMCAGDGGYPSITMTKRRAAFKLLAYGVAEVDSVYVPQMPGIDPDAMIAAAVNEGRGIVNYRGNPTFPSGWTPLDFTSTDVQNYVHNGWRLPLVLSVSCASGEYPNQTCFGEHWLMTPENNGDTRGCIAFFGSTSWSTHTKQNNWLDRGTIVGLTAEDIGRVTGAAEYGKMWMLGNLGHSYNTENAFYQYGVLGDPCSLIWMDCPWPLQVAHPSTIGPGTQSITVWVKDHTGSPLNGALICVWKGPEVHEYAYSVVAGAVNLVIDPASPGTMNVTVTCKNKLAYEGAIEVVAGDVTPPEPVSDLAIALTAQGEVYLAWTEVTEDTTGGPETMGQYDVYRHTEAYLDPQAGLSPLATVPAGTTAYTDASSGVGQPELNHFYCVVAVDQAGNRSAPSDRVGEVDYNTQE